MRVRSRILAACLIAAVGLAAPAVRAFIAVKTPLSNVLTRIAKIVLVGQVTAVDGGTAMVKVTDTLRGEKPGETITLGLTDDLAKTVKAGDPLIVFFDPATTLVHVHDGWYIARGKDVSGLKVAGRHANGARDTFPGTTAGLIAAAKELATTGKTTLLDVFPERALNGDEREIAKLPVKNPTAFVAGDVNGDGRPDLVVCADGKARLFIGTGKGFDEQTDKWGLRDVQADTAAFLDPVAEIGTAPAAPRITLLLGATAYTETGGRFVADASQSARPDVQLHLRLRKPESDVLGAVVGRFGPVGEASVILIAKTKLMRIKADDYLSMAKKDKPDFPIDDDTRLTGGPVTAYHDAHKTNGFKAPKCVALDVNGDGRKDLFVYDQGEPLLLLNRGFGTFLVDAEAGKGLKHAGEESLLAAAAVDPTSKRESLLELTADGTLYAVETVGGPATSPATAP